MSGRMWAVYWPDGRLWHPPAVATKRSDAIRHALHYMNDRFSWPQLKRRYGLTVERVVVTRESEVES